MIHASSNLVDRKNSEELHKVKESCTGRRELEQGSHTRQKKKIRLVIARLLSLEGTAGVYQAEDLTSADQEFPDWLKTPFLGELKPP